MKKDGVQIVTGTLLTNVMNAIGPIAFREKVFPIVDSDAYAAQCEAN